MESDNQTWTHLINTGAAAARAVDAEMTGSSGPAATLQEELERDSGAQFVPDQITGVSLPSLL